MCSKEVISKSIKRTLFSKYFGYDRRVGSCFCCNKNITADNYHAGHVLPEKHGGQVDYYNLRPVCVDCNLLMGTIIMHEYILAEYKDKRYWDPKDIPYVIISKCFQLLTKEVNKKLKRMKLNMENKKKYLSRINPRKDPFFRLDQIGKILSTKIESQKKKEK